VFTSRCLGRGRIGCSNRRSTPCGATDMLDALPFALAPMNLLFAVIGLVVGVVFGAIPGLSATLAIALFVPITFVMQPTHGMTMLGGIYAGAIFGGSISAILVNIPGTPASIVSAWEGHAMAKRGEAPYALCLAAISSGVGGFISAVVMLFLAPVLATLALTFGAAEYVGLVLFSLVMVVIMMPSSLVRNTLSCVLGLVLATVGFDPTHGTPRFTFGFSPLTSGFSLVAVLIGFFCMTQALILAREAIADRPMGRIDFTGATHAGRILSIIFSNGWNYLRSTTIGIFLGIMPAIGPESTPFIAHALQRRLSKTPEEFGKGSEAGLIASETSISANVGGSLIPLLSLGIPGSGAAAMFIGALTLHGLRPGPLLFVEHGQIVYAFLIAFAVTNIVMMLFGLFVVRYFAAALLVPKNVTASFVALFSVFGAYAVNNSMFDVWIMFMATGLAFVMRFLNIPILPLVLGLILGNLLEENLVVMMLTVPTLEAFLRRPIALVFFSLAAITLLISFYNRLLAAQRQWALRS
jgi:putative tricarboxylic transport membrane protein